MDAETARDRTIRTTARTFRISRLVGIVEIQHQEKVALLEGGHMVEVDDDDAEELLEIIRAMDRIESSHVIREVARQRHEKIRKSRDSAGG